MEGKSKAEKGRKNRKQKVKKEDYAKLFFQTMQEVVKKSK